MWKWIKSNAVIIGAAILGLLVFFRDVIFSLLLGSARKTSRETKEKAKKHAEAAAKAKANSDSHKEKAEKIEDEIKDIDADEDWHLKRED